GGVTPRPDRADGDGEAAGLDLRAPHADQLLPRGGEGKRGPARGWRRRRRSPRSTPRQLVLVHGRVVHPHLVLGRRRRRHVGTHRVTVERDLPPALGAAVGGLLVLHRRQLHAADGTVLRLVGDDLRVHRALVLLLLRAGLD